MPGLLPGPLSNDDIGRLHPVMQVPDGVILPMCFRHCVPITVLAVIKAAMDPARMVLVISLKKSPREVDGTG